MLNRTRERIVVWLLAAALGGGVSTLLPGRAAAQGRFLAKEDITLLGIGLQVQPAQQTVPVNIATIVSTYLQSPGTLPQGVPPFAPDAVVQATLRGPSYPNGLDLTAKPNTPFNIPPLGVSGLHTLENIRLVSGGQVLLYGAPQSVTIDVIDKLLVTQVTARPLTADEIRAKGIVFDKSSFQAYNFTAAFAIQNQTINLSFPVVLPTPQSTQLLTPSTADVPTIPVPQLPTLQTIIPDTLKLQTQIPNLAVVGFTLKVPDLQGQNLIVPPIPGVIVIPGNIGFLNQFFSVTLMVGNVAPAGSNLVVSDLTAQIALPPGSDGVLGTPDDPLRMAHTANGDSSSSRPVVQPGPDGKAGTADDVTTLGPGQTGQAEFLVEGLREGTHAINISMTGTLNGLPVGPVPISGAATGAVLVRNPSFTLTFTHPDTVSAGDPYTLDVTVTNTSQSPANFVTVSLLPQNLSGATLTGDSTQQIDSIPPADSATVHFSLVSKVTGKVTAATLDSDQNVAGRFVLKSSVGELGVPVSPDSLVLPPQASSLPDSLRNAAIGMLGKAWAVATAPSAALPANISRFSQKIVYDRAVQVAEAGFRVALHDPVPNTAWQLEMDMAGSDISRLSAVYPNPSDVTTAQSDFPGFDNLRRLSVRGDVLAGAVADLLSPDLASEGVTAFHANLAQQITYRPGHISVLIGTGGGALPLNLVLLDGAGNQVGGVDATGKIQKSIPYSDYLTFKDGNGAAVGELALVAAPAQGPFTIALSSVPGGDPSVPVTLSIVVPDATGHLRQLVFQGVTATTLPTLAFTPSDPYQLSVTMNGGASGTALASGSDAAIQDLPPSIEGVVQQAQADVQGCPDGVRIYPGRVIAVLFSKEVTPASAQDGAHPQDITNYTVDGNAVVAVALQPGRRIAFLALRDPIGPFVQRQLTATGIADATGQALTQGSAPIEATVTADGAVVSGRVLQADGTPLAYANVRLFAILQCDGGPVAIGISSKTADANGQYSWDYVLRLTDRIQAVNTDTGDYREVNFTPQRNGQRLTVDAVLLGRGTFTGKTVAQDGTTPLKGTTVRLTSLTDQSQYSAITDDAGSFTIARVPVGTLIVDAVNLSTNARITLSDYMPSAGATLSRTLTLLTVQQTPTTIQRGDLAGHVYRGDGTTPVSGVPVVVYYASNSQPNVLCPGLIPPFECAVAVGTTDALGAFSFTDVTAGSLRVQSFDQLTVQQGDARVVLTAGASLTANVLLAAGLGTVHGTVLDPSGRPVAGARVGGGLSLTTTDANGQFTLTDVPVGQATIVAVSDALGSKASATVNIVRDGESVNATLVLDSVASIAGTVYAADGVTPVAGNKVWVLVDEGSDDPSFITVVGSAVTDTSGHYTIGQLPLGAYRVSAFLPDLSDGNIVKVALRFNSQTLRADIRFRGAGGSVHGAVYDADGKTPLKARVGISGDRLVSTGGIGVGFTYVQNFAIVDTDFTTGQYSVAGLWTGPFSISAVGQFSPDPITVGANIPSPGASVQEDLRLQPTSRISGTVFLPDGVTPAGPNIAVTFHSDAFKLICDSDGNCTTIPQGIQEENVVTDANGQYLLPIVNAGTFTITATDPATGKTAQVHGAARAGQHVDLPIRLLGIGQLTVNVLASDAKTPIPGAKVEVVQLDYPNKDVTLYADTSGATAFTGGDALSEGQLVITATDMRNGLAGRASTKISSDGQQVAVNVYLYTASGTVAGTVFRPDGTTPVPNADVVISNASGPLAFTVTDASGNYAQDLIPLGPFTVDVFEAATARRGSGTGRIDLDQQTVPLNITEAALGTVKGTVVESGTLSPLVGATVNLTTKSAAGRSLPLLQTQTGTDGTFSFPGIPLGDFSLSLYISQNGVSGSGQANGTIESEGQIVDVPMIVDVTQPTFGRIQGTVYNPDGSTAANTQVSITTPNGFPTVTAGSDGSFSLDHVQIGRFFVTATSPVTHDVGSAAGELSFDGQIADVPVVLVGLSQVNGVVVTATGQPAAGAQLALTGSPSTGCGGPCTLFADANGNFSFINLPAQIFNVVATDPVSGLKGAVGGTLRPGQTASVRIVLQPGGTLRGRVLSSGGTAMQGVTADLKVNGVDLFATTAADGTFSYDAVPLVPYTLTLQDPLGSGVARRVGTVTGTVDLGDIALADGQLAVASVTPLASAIGVPVNQAVQVAFNQAIDFSTAVAANFILTAPDGTVIPETLSVGSGGTTVTVTPVNPLAAQTQYALRVTNIADPFGRTLGADYSETFTTVDVTPPSIVDLTPAANSTGVPLAATVRVQFSEPIDPSRFAGPPLTLTGPSGAISSRIDYLLGNTVIVLTPLQPLSTGTAYHVQSLAASDSSGNIQPAALSYTFTTTTLTPPQINALTASAPSVIQGTSASVTADVGNQDVAFVDFYLNDVFSGTVSSSPFTFRFQANPNLGAPGAQIKVSAVATDTTGLRGQTPVATFVGVVADQPPAVSISAPAGGTTVKNGDRVNVVVHATDDVGVTQMGYKAGTGRAADAAARAISPASLDHTETFGFNIPADAAPNSTITVQASGVDTAGHTVQAAPIALTVLDSIAPTVTITGATTGTKVTPGQQTTVVVSAQDLGGVASISFTASGASSFTQTRTITPSQNSAVTSFTFTVAPTAQPGQSVTVSATATDQSGNVGTAASLILPVADTIPPTVHLHTASGSLEMVRGATVDVVADADDTIAVGRIDLTGSGAFTMSDSRAVSPPTGSAEVTFTIAVPADLQPGQVLNLQATATDTSGNVSLPAALSLTTETLPAVVFPASAVLVAGESQDIAVQLSDPAPTGGITVDLATADENVATVITSVAFAAGESSKNITVTGVAGGTTALTGAIQGVARGTMTLTVRGGIVSGTVYDPQFNPVANAQVTIGAGFGTASATTDANGSYFVEGQAGPSITVKALDPVSKLLGFATGQMNRQNGFVQINVVLIPAGTIEGTVRLSDAQTLAGAGIQVRLFKSGDLNTPIATTFTDQASAYTFPLVAVGDYIVDAADAAGNRGQATVSITGTGQDLIVPVTYLGQGTVTGTVEDVNSAPVANATVTLVGTSVFGQAAPVTVNAGSDGTFSFPNVFIGTFSVTAQDPVSHQGGAASGSITSSGQVVPLTVQIAPSGALQGVVYRSDGTTPVPGANVTLHVGTSVMVTTTDTQGQYSFAFVPLGGVSVSVSDSGTRGIGSASTTLTNNGATVTLNVTLLPQGSLAVTVHDANGNPVAGAALTVWVPNAQLPIDVLTGQTGADGIAVIDHVLAGPFTIVAHASGLEGVVNGTLPANTALPVTVTLQPTASIAGTIFEPDGQTPAADAQVWVSSSVYASARTNVNADGTFRLDGLPLGSYSLNAADANDRLRVIATVDLTTNGQLVSQTFSYVALGSVTGRVINPDSSSAQDMGVRLQSLNPQFGRFFSAITNAAGFYEIDGVPAGTFTLTTGDSTRLLLGEGSGAITQDGQVVNVDILLQGNAVNMPTTLYDANDFDYDIYADAATYSGTNGVFYGNFGTTRGAPFLDIVASGTPTRFTGSNIGTYEVQKQSVAVQQQNLAGLSVTRKVYVPRDGYFSRHLEILQNPTANPITVDVRVTSYLRGYSGGPRVIGTSSGDGVLSVADATNPDRWVVVDDGVDNDPWTTYGTPAVAFAFDGAGAPGRVSSAALATLSPNQSSTLTYQWTSVTIPAGATVEYMYFVAQQASRAAAVASAQRLEQLPPEALAGLGPLDIQSIRNFVVPADGVGTVSPLPPLTGTVSGHLYEFDGTTVVPNSLVYFQSADPLFGHQQSVFADANGRFTLAGSVTINGGTIPVPAEGYTLTARHGVSAASSPAVDGSFTAGATTSTTDVIFSNTSIVRGMVRRTSGTVVPGASVSISGGPGVSISETATSATDGSFTFFGVPGGTYQERASLSNPQGSALISTANLTVTAGQPTNGDITMPATGAVSGVVLQANGVPSAGASVGIATPGFSRNTHTDTSGRYTFTDVPAGSYTLSAVDPRNTVRVSLPVTVSQDQTTAQDVALLAVGTVQVQVNFTRGAPAPGAPVFISSSAGWNGYHVADQNGQVTFLNVPAGTLTLQSNQPANYRLTISVTATLVNEGDVVPVTLTLPSAAAVSGQVTFGNGTIAQGASVYLNDPVGGTYLASAAIDSTGTFTFNGIPLGVPLTLTAQRPYPYSDVNRVVAVPAMTADGQVQTENIVLPAIATVRVTAKRFDGTPFAGARVDWQDSSQTYLHFGGYADANGQLQITPVREGPVTLVLYDPNNFAILKTATATVNPTDEGGIIDVVIQVTSPGGTVQGTIYANDGTTPVDGAYVEVDNASDGHYLAYTYTATDGTYQLTNVQPGDQGFTVLSRPPTGTTTVTATGQFTSQGQVVTIDLTLPIVKTTIQGTIFANDGTSPVPNTTVWLYDTAQSYLDSTSTDGNGAYQFFNVWVPLAGVVVTAQSPDDYTVVGTQPVTPTTNGQTVTANVTVPVVFGSVHGTVYAGDGSTPIGGSEVDLTETGGGGGCSECGGMFLFASTAADGTYRFDPFYAAASGFTVTVWGPTGPIAQNGALTVQNQDLQLDVVLPITVVKGRVTYPDGTPPTSLQVFLTTADGGTYYANTTGSDGSYTIFAAPAGQSVTITAQDLDTGLTSTATATVANLGSATTVDLVLPLSGTVTGHVTDASGNPVASASVALVSSGVAFQRTAGTDASGLYTFAHVPVGAFYIQASFFDQSGVAQFMSANGRIQNAGDTITVDLSPAAGGQLTGTVQRADGSSVPNANVRISSFGSAGPLGHFTFGATADQNGGYQVLDVPLGVVQVIAIDPGNSADIGIATGTLASTPLTLDVVLGNGVSFPYNLDGADGFRYDVTSDGSLNDGGTITRSLTDAYDGAYNLTVNGAGFPLVDVGAQELDARQLVLGPVAMGQLTVTRKIFVPAAGGFARYLEIVSNPSGVPVPASIAVSSNLGSDSNTRLIVAPADTQNTYAVTDQSGNCCDPALGHVFSGLTPPVPLSSVFFASGNDSPSYGWQVTVPAGGTVIIMHFALQRNYLDPTVVAPAAQALRDLTDPNALLGLTAAEKLAIQNFVIPQ